MTSTAREESQPSDTAGRSSQKAWSVRGPTNKNDVVVLAVLGPFKDSSRRVGRERPEAGMGGLQMKSQGSEKSALDRLCEKS